MKGTCRTCHFWERIPGQPRGEPHYGYCKFPVFLPNWLLTKAPGVTGEENENCPVHQESVKEKIG